jgi:hypothetical protein
MVGIAPYFSDSAPKFAMSSTSLRRCASGICATSSYATPLITNLRSPFDGRSASAMDREADQVAFGDRT